MTPFNGHPLVQDEECVDLIRSGGAAGATARKVLYLRYRDRMYHAIRQMMQLHPGCMREPNDLLHDSFIVLIRKIESGIPVERSILIFWKGIARRLLQNVLRRDQRYLMVADAEAEIFDGITLSAEDYYLQSEARESLVTAFRQLPERYQEFLVMWMDNYSVGEITARLQLASDNATHSLKYKCFKKLKDLLRMGHKLPFPGP
jgi:RNA polymerase sigma factor (sigma-70 family)